MVSGTVSPEPRWCTCARAVAQAGGADAADFAQNLQRMYLRWAERHGYPTEIYYTSYAEEAGIKSTTFVV